VRRRCVSLDMHQRRAGYTFAPADVVKRLEQTYTATVGCAHELAFSPLFGWRVKKKGLKFSSKL
jgi:hypothetical protein